MKTKENRLPLGTLASLILSVLTALAGIARLFAQDEKLLARLDMTTLTYLGVAGALLILPRIKSLAFGDYKLELQEIANKANEALEEAKTAASMAQHLSPGQPPSESGAAGAGAIAADPESDGGTTKQFARPQASAEQNWERSPGAAHDDPWKDVFGGQRVANGRRIEAEVVPSADDDGWFRIRIWVESTDTKNNPLSGKVRFFLHDTFSRNKPYVTVVNHQAELRLKAWGAFTVGALTDDGKTQLEFDLSSEKSFPRKFREN